MRGLEVRAQPSDRVAAYRETALILFTVISPLNDYDWSRRRQSWISEYLEALEARR